MRELEGKHQKIKIGFKNIKNERRNTEGKRSTENKEGRAECLSIFFLNLLRKKCCGFLLSPRQSGGWFPGLHLLSANSLIYIGEPSLRYAGAMVYIQNG